MLKKTNKSFALLLCFSILLFLLIIPSVSAFEFDNVKHYDAVTREVTIKNCNLWVGTCLIQGDSIGKARLNTPLNVKVGQGYQKVAEFDLLSYGDYNEALKQFTFKDLNDKGTNINRDYDLKYLTYENVMVNDYNTNCSNTSNKVLDSKANKNFTICNEVLIGEHMEIREVWKDVTSSDFKKNKKLTVGVFTTVEKGDYVDWIPTIYGIEVKEWATWTEDLNTDIISYYRLDDNLATTNAIDAVGTVNGTASTNTENLYTASGVINSAFNLVSASSEYVDIGTQGTLATNMGDGFTWNGWIKTTATGSQTLFGMEAAGGAIFYSKINTQHSTAPDQDKIMAWYKDTAGNSVRSSFTNDNSTFRDGDWHMITITIVGSTADFFVDSINIPETYGASDTTTDSSSFGENILLGATNFQGTPNAFFNGDLDEVGIWNRVLNSTEITQLYNDGDGITYTDSFNIAPTITLNSPSSANYTTTQNVVMNYTAYDDINLTDVKLYVNDVLNQTNATGINNSDYLFDLSLGDGDYTIYGKATDSDSEETNSDSIRIVIDTTPNIQYTANTRVDNYNSTSSYLPVEVTVTETYFDTISFNINGTITNYTDATRLYNESMTDGAYDYNVTVYTTTGQSNSTETRTINIDNTFPQIVAQSPTGILDYNYAGGNETLNATFTDTNLDSCWYWYGENDIIFEDIPTPYFSANYSFNYVDIDNASLKVTYTTTYGSSVTNDSYFSLENCTTTNITATSYCSGLLSVSCSNNFTCGETFIGAVGTSQNAIFQKTGIINIEQFNGYTNTTIDGCLSGISNSTNFNLIDGIYNMILYANDTFGQVSMSVINWSYKFFETEITFEENTTEGELNEFVAEVVVADGYSVSEAVFNYNNTNYTTSISYSDGEYFISSSQYAPIVTGDTNISFQFFITVNGVVYNTTTHNQTVVDLTFSVCGDGSDDVLLTMFLKDENAKTALNGTIEVSADIISKSSGLTVETLSSQFEDITEASICFTPNSTYGLYYLDAEIKYYADGYASEFYFIQDADMVDYPANLSLYDLNLNDSTEFLIKYQDDTLVTVEGAVVQLLRKYISEDVYEVVEAPLTSNIGTAVVHIDLDTNLYRAIVVKDGVILDTFNNLVFDCENELSGYCTQNLFGLVDAHNTVSSETLNDFSYSVASVNHTITTTFSIPSGTPASINILLTQKDSFSTISLCNTTITSSSGSIDCDYNDTIGNSVITLFISKNGELMAQKGYFIIESGAIDWLDNNFFIVLILLLSLVGMAMASPEWMIMNAVITMVLCGALFLLNGLDFVVGLGGLIWLIVSAVILIMKLSTQEDK